MAAMPKKDAVQQLVEEIAKLDREGLGEVFGEFFPEVSTKDLPDGVVKDRINERLRKGLEEEEIVDLWNVVFPRDRYVRMEDDSLYRNEPVPFGAECGDDTE